MIVVDVVVYVLLILLLVVVVVVLCPSAVSVVCVLRSCGCAAVCYVSFVLFCVVFVFRSCGCGSSFFQSRRITFVPTSAFTT